MTAVEQYEALTKKIKITPDLIAKKALLQELYILVDTFSEHEKELIFHATPDIFIKEKQPLKTKIAAAGLPTFEEFYLGVSVTY